MEADSTPRDATKPTPPPPPPPGLSLSGIKPLPAAGQLGAEALYEAQAYYYYYYYQYLFHASPRGPAAAASTAPTPASAPAAAEAAMAAATAAIHNVQPIYIDINPALASRECKLLRLWMASVTDTAHRLSQPCAVSIWDGAYYEKMPCNRWLDDEKVMTMAWFVGSLTQPFLKTNDRSQSTGGEHRLPRCTGRHSTLCSRKKIRSTCTRRPPNLLLWPRRMGTRGSWTV